MQRLQEISVPYRYSAYRLLSQAPQISCVIWNCIKLATYVDRHPALSLLCTFSCSLQYSPQIIIIIKPLPNKKNTVGRGGDRNLVTGLTSQDFVHSSCPKPQLQLTISHPWIVLELFRLSAPTLATDATKSWFLYRPSNSYQRNFAKTSPIVDFQLLLALHILHFSNEDNVDAKRDQDKQVKPV